MAPEPELFFCALLQTKRRDTMPPGRIGREKSRPICEELPGWHQSLQGARSMADLPTQARRYLERISEVTGVRLAMVGTGAGREETIMLANPFHC